MIEILFDWRPLKLNFIHLYLLKEVRHMLLVTTAKCYKKKLKQQG